MYSLDFCPSSTSPASGWTSLTSRLGRVFRAVRRLRAKPNTTPYLHRPTLLQSRRHLHISIALRYSDKIGPAKGLSQGGKITLLSGMQTAEEFSVLVHEIGHEMLHGGERRTLTTKSVRETEAEAVAFVVCQAIGLDTGSAFSDYIALWKGDADLLRESLEAVQQTAA